MAHHKSAIKRIKTNQKSNLRNRHYRSALRTISRRVKESGSADNLQYLNQAYSLIDKLVVKGILHRNAAARRKSRLARIVSSKISSTSV